MRQLLSAAFSISLLVSCASPAWCAGSTQPNALTKLAADEFSKGNLEQAVALQEKALHERPNDWLSHASMSFYAWHQGDILKAVDQGQAAAQLAPHSYVALTNLALIKEGLEDCNGAISFYEAAAKIEPSEWTPPLGMARCLSKIGKPEQALAVMQAMRSRTDGSFEWYLELADTYIRMDKPDLAVMPVERAVALASTPEQKQAASTLSLLAYLQTNQLDKAQALRSEVFDNCAPKNQQIYVRTAVSLLAASDPAAGESLLKTAVANLTTDEDAEAFYRLGKAFEEKTLDKGIDATTHGAWLKSAELALQRANKLAERPKYYMALAAIFDEENKPADMEQALQKVHQLENWNTLAPYLLSKGRGGLDKVDIKIDNLNCSCHISKVVEALTQVDGVAYVYIPSNVKPYEGMMLIDQSKVSLPDAFAKATETTKAFYASMNPPVVPSFSSSSKSRFASAAEAIDAAQFAQYGSITSFYNAFKAVVPFEPIAQLAARAKSGRTL